jgi:hypothetical protein
LRHRHTVEQYAIRVHASYAAWGRPPRHVYAACWRWLLTYTVLTYVEQYGVRVEIFIIIFLIRVTNFRRDRTGPARVELEAILLWIYMY